MHLVLPVGLASGLAMEEMVLAALDEEGIFLFSLFFRVLEMEIFVKVWMGANRVAQRKEREQR